MLNMELQDYIDWNVQSVFKRIDRNKYAYRVVLFYGDGTKRVRLCSGFSTKKEAEEARKITIGKLVKDKIAEYTRRLAKALHVKGLINIQFIDVMLVLLNIC